MKTKVTVLFEAYNTGKDTEKIYEFKDGFKSKYDYGIYTAQDSVGNKVIIKGGFLTISEIKEK